MTPAWAQRQEALLRDCIVSPGVFESIVDRLCDFVVPYQHALETEARKRHVHLYLIGLLSHLDRKNAETIAAFVDVERLVLQEFIGTAPWDHRPLLTVLVGQVVEQLGEPDGVIAFDPSSFPKRGTHSVGVKRQWCGHQGKVDNCQVGVYMGYVSRHNGSVSKVEIDCDGCHTGPGVASFLKPGVAMTYIAVRCLHCQSEQIVKRGKTRRGTQHYLCQNTACTTGSFLLDYRNRGCLPEVKQTIIDMSLNASGIRDTARVLRISTDTVLSELKKKEAMLASVNTALLRTLHPEQIVVDIEQAGEAEIDEMWSFVGNKGNPRWLWHAIGAP
jgi:transposase-like protein